MSQEVIDALANGEIDPITYWVRHASVWDAIATATPLDDVEDMYKELRQNAFDVAEFLAFAPAALN